MLPLWQFFHLLFTNRPHGGSREVCHTSYSTGWLDFGFAADKVVVLSVLAGLVAVHTELAAMMIASILAPVTSQGEQPAVCLSTLHII